MIVSTCETVPGREIVAVLGLARGNTIRARHIGRDITAGIKGLLRRRDPGLYEIDGREP